MISVLTSSFFFYCMLSGTEVDAILMFDSIDQLNQLKRRKMMWALYVMRDPFFANYTK